MNGPVQVATDGACLGNPGPGGWAWTTGLTDASGGQYVTTNQEMELRAILEALRAHPDQAIVILTDSQYAIDCVTTWLPGWRRRGWQTSARRPVKHQPTIKAIAAEQDRRTVQLVKVPGHAGHPLNERADRLAAAAAAQAALTVQQLETGPLHRFEGWPNDQVPKRAAGVYSVWDGDQLLYVGMSGRAMTAEDLEVSPNGRVVAKGLWTRLNAHAAGRRSGDQFCVDVCDRFVVPALTPSQQQQLAAGGLSLDDLTRRFIRDRLAYRFVVTADGTEAARLEVEVRRGALSVGRPYLNPLEPPWS